jgi:UDP-glucose 4-epimerase
MSRILVTGGAGFIGSHLVDRLIKEEFEVAVLDSFFSGTIENLEGHLKSGQLTLIRGDIRKSADVRKAISGVSTVFHFAAIVNVQLSIKNPKLTREVNVNGTSNVLEASLAENVEKFINISTCAVYGESHYLPLNEEHPTMPLSPYGVSKLDAENYSRLYHQIHGLRTCCLRLFNVYGPRQHAGPYSGVITQFIRKLEKSQSPVIYGDGEQTRDFIHVDDVADACMLAMKNATCEGETYNIGTGRPMTITELAHILIGFYGKTALRPIYKAPKKGDIKNSYADISKARKMLNFEPKIKLENGIKTILS